MVRRVLKNTELFGGDAAVTQLQAEIHEVHIARLSPLKQHDLSLHGHYRNHRQRPGRGLRPLLGPDTPELDENDASAAG
ncbi:hypothetical protein ABZ402_06075 [Streptomyces mirabilis]|uniref:hypothetical protein n=1 Tax=Streptomyces mirabilis TaxID=68239 RepID=UPI003404FF90